MVWYNNYTDHKIPLVSINKRHSHNINHMWEFYISINKGWPFNIQGGKCVEFRMQKYMLHFFIVQGV